MNPDTYSMPPNVRLDHPDLDPALAAVGIDHRSYLANGTLTHHFRDRLHPERWLAVVESHTSKQPTEVVGQSTLWLLVRDTAQVCNAALLAHAERCAPFALAA